MAFSSFAYGDWKVIAIGATVISVIVSIMLILIARLFNQPEFENYAKAELTYAASTILIVMMVMAMIDVAEPLLAKGDPSANPLLGNVQYGAARCMYLSSFRIPCDSGLMIKDAAGNYPNTLIDWMKLYMETPASCVQSYMTNLYYLSIPAEAGSSVFMEIFMSEHASGFGFKWIAERISNAAMSLSFYMYAFYLIVHTLNFVKAYAGFFFSVGVALRAFPPTRGAGAYVMALSLGLYFILPLSYILIATVSLPFTQAEIIRADPGALAMGNLKYQCMLPAIPDAHVYACEGPSMARAFEWRDRLLASAANLEDMLTFRLNDLARHLVSAICIFPLIAFIVLLTFVLNATTLLGGNIPEVGRGLVKLI